jgi:pimeloyl-ACP methyl ester carboxylesterase
VNPCQFGRDGQALFGLYHPPRPSVARDGAVLICAPIGQEYMRTHRTLRQLALQLSSSGLHVLRFDYFGTGDSAGEMSEASTELWLDDIGRAHAELADIAGAQHCAVVGLRTGALLAAVASARGLLGATRLVLWDPLVAGQLYLAQLKALHETMVRTMRPFPAVPSDELLGYAYPPALRRGLEGLDLDALVPSLKADRVDLALSQPRPELERLETSLRAAGKAGVVSRLEEDGAWEVFPRQAFGTMIASKAVQAVSGLVLGEGASGVP